MEKKYELTVEVLGPDKGQVREVRVLNRVLSWTEQGIQYDFRPFQIAYAVIKTTVFAFIITSVSAYCGYYVRGGALEVGRASTQAVVWSIVLIMTFNVILTQVLLL